MYIYLLNISQWRANFLTQSEIVIGQGSRYFFSEVFR